MMKSAFFLCIPILTAALAQAADFASHPPIRPLPEPSERPLPGGPKLFVDPAKGNDASEGAKSTPWRTLQHALTQLRPGDTLVLRGGVYYEQVKCALSGTPEKPITIRSYPGELAVLDGGFAEFYNDPANAWVPVEGNTPGEFRSSRRYGNITGVAGMFGDSNIGLLTYWRIEDLRSDNQTWSRHPEKKIFDADLYCGPGLYHDPVTGYIHCRLAHTDNPHPEVSNYQGETNPRKLPLVIGPVDSIPLHLDHARHVRIQDLVIRGGGEQSALLEYCTAVELDDVVFLCGNITGKHSGPVKITHSAVYGRVPPWMWRIDSSKGCASGTTRDVARMINPTLLQTSHQFERYSIPRKVSNAIHGKGDNEQMPQMIHYMRNHDWEISWSEFTDGHDGVFLIGKNMKFHHNFIEDIQDDATDISAAMPDEDDTMILTNNLIRRVLTAFSSHNYNVHWPRGKAYIARNIVDQREGIRWIRCSPDNPQGNLRTVGVFLLHGSDAAEYIESVYFYHNTCIAPTRGMYAFGHRTMFHMKPGSERRVLNNLFVYLNDDGLYPRPLYGVTIDGDDLQFDANLHWNPHPDAAPKPDFFDELREDHGLAANDFVANPKFIAFTADGKATNDYRLEPDSPAIAKGVALPSEWPDSQRSDAERPDLGAVPLGADPPQFGRHGRIRFPAQD